MIKLLGKNKKATLRVGFTTHNGAEAITAYAKTNALAREAVAAGQKNGGTNKEQSAAAVKFLKEIK